MKKVAVITGASSGIGQAAAALFLHNGWTVYNISRRPGPDPAVFHVPADVTDESEVRAAFAQIAEREGGIDLLLNNAGFGISGAAEFTDTCDAQRLFEVNFFGVLRCSKEAVPLLRARGGRIINVSSAAALFSIPFQAFYSASKAAVNSLTLAMDSELKSFGIRVSAVMPGDVRTGFTQAREKNTAGEDVYGGSISRSVGVMEKDEQKGMDPSAIAACIYRMACEKNPKPLRTVGFQYKLFAFLFKILPTRLLNWLVGKLYVK